MAKTQSTMVRLGTDAPPFELLDVLSNRVLGRDDIMAGAENRGLLVMFICVHCPYVKHTEQELARIGQDYDGKIGIAAIQSNDIAAYPEDGPDGMREQAQRLGFRFAYLLDATQEVARSYDAACTPDFFLFDAERKLVYRGQLDDSRPYRGDGGSDIPVSGPVTGKDLRAAIDAVLAGKRPDTNQRTSLGCNIKWRA